MPGDARGRYVIGDEIASGGMATIHLGRALEDAGLARTVAIKRLHPQYAKDPDFTAMLLDEGRLTSRIRHANVVSTLDVVAAHSDLFIVMEYIHGESLSGLLRAVARRNDRIPAAMAAGIVAGVLRGLHAAHEARDTEGHLLGVVHRDVSPQNILVGVDGRPRVLDFGIAKAAGRAHATETGQVKGKFAYMPPEQLSGEPLDRRVDVYAAGIVLWESLVGARLFAGLDRAPNLARLLDPRVDPPSMRVPGLSPRLDAVTLRALEPHRDARFPTALAMAEALEAAGPVATASELGAWVRATAGDALAARARHIEACEQDLTRRLRDARPVLDTLEEPITQLRELPFRPLPPEGLLAGGSTLRSGWLLGAAGTLLVVTGLVVGVLVRRGAVLVPPLATTGALPPLPAAASLRGAPDASVPPLPAAASLRGAPDASVSPLSPLSSRPTAGPSTAPSPAQRRPRGVDCTPPFTIDADGHKHYKRACLR